MTVDNYLAELGALTGLAGIMAGWMHSQIVGVLTTVAVYLKRTRRF